MTQFKLDTREDEEDVKRLKKILKKTPKLIPAEIVYKKADLS